MLIHRHLTTLLVLLAALFGAVALVSVAGAQDVPSQCSDGADNDSDNAVDGADAGCGPGFDDDETDSPYSGIVIQTRPIPVVTLRGRLKRSGAIKVNRIEIRAVRASDVRVTCSGRSCPVRSIKRRMLTTKLRLSAFKGRTLKPGVRLVFRVGRQDSYGKFVKYTVRRGKPPLREDDCLLPETGKQGPCFT